MSENIHPKRFFLTIDWESLGAGRFDVSLASTTHGLPVFYASHSKSKGFPAIGLGAVLMRSDGEVIKTFQAYAYYPEYDPIEARCWNEFWRKNQETLASFAERSPTFPDHPDAEWPELARTEMMQGFYAFVQGCVAHVTAIQGGEILWTSDNPGYDFGLTNELMRAYLPPVALGETPRDIPYLPTLGYEGYFCKESAGAELLAVFEKKPPNVWGVDLRLRELFEVPPALVQAETSDHNPLNDAKHIAINACLVNLVATHASTLLANGPDPETGKYPLATLLMQ